MGIIIIMTAIDLYRMLLGHTNYIIRSGMSLRWIVREVKCLWGETYVGWNARGVNVTGWNVLRWNVFGVKCDVTVRRNPCHHSFLWFVNWWSSSWAVNDNQPRRMINYQQVECNLFHISAVFMPKTYKLRQMSSNWQYCNLNWYFMIGAY